MALRLRTALAVDLVGQAACCIWSATSMMIGGSGLSGAFFRTPVSLLLVLGSWQLLSALLWLAAWSRLPGRKRARRIHLRSVAVLAVLFGVTLAVLNDSGLFAVVVFGGLLLVAGPLLALLYFLLTAVALRELTLLQNTGDAEAGPESIPKEDLRQTKIQVLMLALAVVPFAALGGTVSAGVLSLLSVLIGYALAAWLLLLLVRDYRSGMGQRGEMICALLFLACFVFQVLFRRFGGPFSLRGWYFIMALDPRLFLAVWVVARQYRPPLSFRPKAMLS